MSLHLVDCDLSDTQVGALKLQQVDGGTLEDIFICLANRDRNYDKPTEQVYGKEEKKEGVPTGSVKNITVRNVKAMLVSGIRKRCGIMVSGIPGLSIENVLLGNIEISYPGGGPEEDAKREVAEDIARYPEQFFFGILPAWGAYVRHAKNVQFKNVKMTTSRPGRRKEIVLIDVKGFINE